VTVFAAKLNRLGVFIVGSLVMATMQVISVSIGSMFPYIFTPAVTRIVSILLFFIFGFYMLYSALCNEEATVKTYISSNWTRMLKKRKGRLKSKFLKEKTKLNPF
jgi:putative Ca2+/H+ antiporter (TMEM165/GDT1 family)